MVTPSNEFNKVPDKVWEKIKEVTGASSKTHVVCGAIGDSSSVGMDGIQDIKPLEEYPDFEISYHKKSDVLFVKNLQLWPDVRDIKRDYIKQVEPGMPVIYTDITWYNIKSVQPELNREVLVLYADGDIDIARYVKAKYGDSCGFQSRAGERYGGEDIVYWADKPRVMIRPEVNR
jgi:hypothetical protein